MKRLMSPDNEIRQKVIEYIKREVTPKGIAWIRSPYAAKELNLKSAQIGSALHTLSIISKTEDLGIIVDRNNHKNWVVRKKENVISQT